MFSAFQDKVYLLVFFFPVCTFNEIKGSSFLFLVCQRALFFFIFYLFKVFVYLFIYGCVGSSFLCKGFL